MKIKLTVTKGKATRDQVTLRLPAIIGRSKETDLTVVHPMVSRRHCELVEVDGLVMIRDLGSLNGTLLGGEKIKEGPVPPAAQFTVGPLSFSIDYEFSGDYSSLPPVVPAVSEDDIDVDESTPIEEPVLELDEEETTPDGETDQIGATADTDGDLALPEVTEEVVDEIAEPAEPEALAEPASLAEPSAPSEEADIEEESMFGFLEEADEEESPAETKPVADAVAAEPAVEAAAEESDDEEELFGFLEEEEEEEEEEESPVETEPVANAAPAEATAEVSDEDEDLFGFLEEEDVEPAEEQASSSEEPQEILSFADEDDEEQVAVSEEAPLSLDIEEPAEDETEEEILEPVVETLALVTEEPTDEETASEEPAVEEDDLFDFLEEDDAEAEPSEPETPAEQPAVAESKVTESDAGQPVDDDDILDFLSDDTDDANSAKSDTNEDDDALDDFFKSLD